MHKFKDLIRVKFDLKLKIIYSGDFNLVGVERNFNNARI